MKPDNETQIMLAVFLIIHYAKGVVNMFELCSFINAECVWVDGLDMLRVLYLGSTRKFKY